MMLATPVRSSAWSSTSMTVAFFAATPRLASLARGEPSTGNVHLQRKVRRLPCQDDFRPAARRGHDGERCANPLRALLHARHPEAARRLSVRDAAAIVRNRQTHADRAHGRGADGDAPRARMPHRVAERLLRDADNLPLDDAAEARQL